MFWSSSRLRRRLPLAVAISFAALLAVTTWPAVQVSGRNPEFSEFCEENPYLATVCYRRSTSSAVAAREPAVVAFRDTPSDTPQYVLATNGQVGSVYGLAFSAQENALYAAAYHKRQIPFGRGGPGAVYRIDLATEEVDQVITVPNAGGDYHNRRYNSEDLQAGPYAGKTSLGDVDVSADGSDWRGSTARSRWT